MLGCLLIKYLLERIIGNSLNQGEQCEGIENPIRVGYFLKVVPASTQF